MKNIKVLKVVSCFIICSMLFTLTTVFGYDNENKENNIYEQDIQEIALKNYFIIEEKLDKSMYGGSYINDSNKLEILLSPDGYTEDDLFNVLDSEKEFDFSMAEFDYVDYSSKELDYLYSFLLDNIEELSISALGTGVKENKVIIWLDSDNTYNSRKSYIVSEEEDLLRRIKNKINNESNNTVKRTTIHNLSLDNISNMLDIILNEDAVPEIQLESLKSETRGFNESLNVEIRATTTLSPTTLLNNGYSTSSIAYEKNGYLISTGHAYDVGDVIYSGDTRIGIVTKNTFDGSIDACKIKLDSNARFSSDIVLSSGTNLPVGKSVYQTGASSGTKSTTITHNNYSYKGNGYTWSGLYRTGISASSGDSGGSLYTTHRTNRLWYVTGVTHASGSNYTLFINYNKLTKY